MRGRRASRSARAGARPAGSMVSYCLGITALDPLRYDLLFERFLNPERNEMPDMDLDFCADRRGEVIDYVRERYGDDHVSQIITFNTMSAKAVIKDVARAMDIPFQRCERDQQDDRGEGAQGDPGEVQGLPGAVQGPGGWQGPDRHLAQARGPGPLGRPATRPASSSRGAP